MSIWKSITHFLECQAIKLKNDLSGEAHIPFQWEMKT